MYKMYVCIYIDIYIYIYIPLAGKQSFTESMHIHISNDVRGNLYVKFSQYLSLTQPSIH